MAKRIEVIKKAYEEGKQIEINLGSWLFPYYVVFCSPKWDMPAWRYRIKKN